MSDRKTDDVTGASRSTTKSIHSMRTVVLAAAILLVTVQLTDCRGDEKDGWMGGDSRPPMMMDDKDGDSPSAECMIKCVASEKDWMRGKYETHGKASMMGKKGEGMPGKHGEKDECMETVEKLCGACEKKETGRECWAKCKEEHKEMISAACEHEKEGFKGFEGMKDFEGMKQGFEGLKELFEGKKEGFEGKKKDFEGMKGMFEGSEEGFEGMTGMKKEGFEGMMKDIEGIKELFEGKKEGFGSLEGMRDFEHMKEGFEGMQKGFEGMPDFFEGKKEGFEGMKAGFEGFEGMSKGFEGMKDFFEGKKEGFEGFEGTMGDKKAGFEGMLGDKEGFEGMLGDKKESFEGFEGTTRSVKGQEDGFGQPEVSPFQSTRVLVAAGTKQDASTDTANNTSSGLTVGIIVGACVVCALLATVIGVVVMRQRQHSTSETARHTESSAVSVVVEAQPVPKADIA